MLTTSRIFIIRIITAGISFLVKLVTFLRLKVIEATNFQQAYIAFLSHHLQLAMDSETPIFLLKISFAWISFNRLIDW